MLYDNFVNAYEKTFEECSRTIGRILKAFLQLKGKGHLLDAGCGNGCISEIFCSVDWEITGIDLSKSMISRALGRELPNCQFLIGDCLKLPFGSGIFDVYLGNLLINNLKDPKTLLTEAYRVLKPDGMILLTYPICRLQTDLLKIMKSALRSVKIGPKSSKPPNFLQHLSEFSSVQHSCIPIGLNLKSGLEACQFLSSLKEIKQLEKLNLKQAVFQFISSKVDQLLSQNKCLVFEICFVVGKKLGL